MKQPTDKWRGVEGPESDKQVHAQSKTIFEMLDIESVTLILLSPCLLCPLTDPATRRVTPPSSSRSSPAPPPPSRPRPSGTPGRVPSSRKPRSCPRTALDVRRRRSSMSVARPRASGSRRRTTRGRQRGGTASGQCRLRLRGRLQRGCNARLSLMIGGLFYEVYERGSSWGGVGRVGVAGG